MCRCPPCWGWACSSATCTCSSLQDCKYHFANKKIFLEDQIAHQFQEYRSHTDCHVPQQVSVAQHVGGRLLRQCPERWLLLEEQTEKVTHFFWCDQSSFRMGQFFTCISGWWSIMIYLSPQLWWRPGHALPQLEQGRHWRCNRRIKSTLRPLSCLTRKVPNCYASLAFFAKFYFFRPQPTPHANKLHVVLLPLGISKFALYVF